jgi:hypothetical protein
LVWDKARVAGRTDNRGPVLVFRLEIVTVASRRVESEKAETRLRVTEIVFSVPNKADPVRPIKRRQPTRTVVPSTRQVIDGLAQTDQPQGDSHSHGLRIVNYSHWIETFQPTPPYNSASNDAAVLSFRVWRVPRTEVKRSALEDDNGFAGRLVEPIGKNLLGSWHTGPSSKEVSRLLTEGGFRTALPDTRNVVTSQ